MEAWDVYEKEKTSYNDKPDKYATSQQLFMLLAQPFGGTDLEIYKVIGSLTTIYFLKGNELP